MYRSSLLSQNWSLVSFFYSHQLRFSGCEANYVVTHLVVGGPLRWRTVGDTVTTPSNSLRKPHGT